MTLRLISRHEFFTNTFKGKSPFSRTGSEPVLERFVSNSPKSGLNSRILLQDPGETNFFSRRERGVRKIPSYGTIKASRKNQLPENCYEVRFVLAGVGKTSACDRVFKILGVGPLTIFACAECLLKTRSQPTVLPFRISFCQSS